MKFRLHVLYRKFDSDAMEQSYNRWDFSEDEDNPKCPLCDELGIRVDVEYTEVVSGADPISYIESLLVDEAEIDQLCAAQPPSDVTYVLVMGLEQNRRLPEPLRVESSELVYLGTFNATFN